ncbi:peptidoglycan recognition family protein [Fodinibius sp. Rm-B-1B1-1]|uniref:N-acetylmuramoyl-L-alanine amidase n=1 Tax=Fodinibius alkaliphilus TaxID=3140241 RepID=UPI00315B024F
MKKVLFGFLVLALLGSCKSRSGLTIQDTPIKFDSTRTVLSLEYLETRYGMMQEEPTITPRMVVVHWTASTSFNDTFNYFYDSRLDASRKNIDDASNLNVSAHYLVKRDGEVHQLLPDTLFARHVIGLNHSAIGIENVGTDTARLTEAQLEANTELIQKLYEKHDIEYLIGHFEYQLFEDHSLWKEVDDEYRTKKSDPSNEFMLRLRKNLSELDFKGPPNQWYLKNE